MIREKDRFVKAGTLDGGLGKLIDEMAGVAGERKLGARGLALAGDEESPIGAERGSMSSADIEQTYVHQPGEVVAEDGEGGKFVVDDKDRIVYVEKEQVEHMLRGLVAKRGQRKQSERSEHI